MQRISSGRAIAITALVAVTMAVGGCGDSDVVTLAADAEPLLVVRTATGVASIDVDGGAVRATAPGGVVSPDRTALVTAMPTASWSPEPESTEVTVVDAATGARRRTFTVAGSLAPRVTTAGAGTIALGPAPAATPGAYPAGRADTELVVVTSDGETTRYRLDGNIEPEAFSTGGDALFVVEFSPPLAPDRYRVRRLDLDTGRVGDVYSVDAHLQEDMRGTARSQVFAPDGSRLYTLYSLDDIATGHRRAFVHVLDLDEQWAHCVDLPGAFADGDAALSPTSDGTRLYVLRRSGDLLAEVDTVALGVDRTTTLTPPLGPVVDAAVAGGRLFVGTAQPAFATVDLATGEPTFSSALPAPLLAVRAAGDRVHLVLTDRIVAVDAATAVTLATVPSPALADTISAGTGAPLMDTGAGAIECAC